jgi:predicted hydrocarbon binding protein
VHGLIFFYLHKFADRVSAGSRSGTASSSSIGGQKHLPSGVYPDAEAAAMLGDLAAAAGRPLPTLVTDFGEFLAPHLVKVAGAFIEPDWTTLDLVEHTETLIHRMVRSTNPGAAPPVLEVFRSAPDEIQVVYSSRRRLCALATGIIRGLAAHFQERVAIEEPSCMLRGDPFCSFVVHREHGDAAPAPAPPVATLVGDAGARLPAEPGIVIDEPTPRMLGDYRVLGLIGSGAMGRVYLAHDDRLDRRVAIKVMSSRSAGNAAARQRFIRESRSVGAIENPHVMTIHQVGEQDGVPYIVMQLLEGRTLRDHRDASGRLPLGEVLRIGREIAAGLAAAHRRGIVHRDIKPANVFLEGESRSVRIIDFGLARELDAHATALTHDGALVGTPSYMPPERIDDGDLDASSDLFGLGVILYELLADRLPFEGRSVAAVLTAIARGTPTPLAEIAPEVPREVGDLVMRLIAHDRAARPADARVVAEELAAFEKRFAG